MSCRLWLRPVISRIDGGLTKQVDNRLHKLFTRSGCITTTRSIQTITTTSASNERDISIYIHWPYCRKLCPYCAFNKYRQPRNYSIDNELPMQAALVAETKQALTSYAPYTPRINSIYFGGGTPSLAKPSTLEAVINTIGQYATVPNNVEISLEGNPVLFDTNRMQSFKDIGINRISLGIQALNDKDLKWLGREHTVQDALISIKRARELFPGRVTFDLIFGRLNQTKQDWTDELKRAMAIADDHLSIYQLTVERGTRLFNKVEAGHITLPDNDVMADMYQQTVSLMTSHGFDHYEVSNYARSTSSRSIHNQGYWMGRDYIGIGPGAHGRVLNPSTMNMERTYRIAAPNHWMKQCAKLGHGLRKTVSLSTNEYAREIIVMAMRMKTGIQNTHFKQLTNESLTMYLNIDQLEKLHDYGYLEWAREIYSYIEEDKEQVSMDIKYVRPTESGLAILDLVLECIID
ncbi:hypothetical protein BDF19DRAFT_424615 [Syncephalis fuscata]|nr:hypothetical protein BDF19DRAFT_424615 [Syncephalis fuscata]